MEKNLKNAQILESVDPRSNGSKKQASVKKMVNPIQSEFVSTMQDTGDFGSKLSSEYLEDDKDNPGKKKPIVGNFAKVKKTMDTIYINGGSGVDGDAISSPTRYESPGLAGFIIRRSDVGILARKC